MEAGPEQTRLLLKISIINDSKAAFLKESKLQMEKYRLHLLKHTQTYFHVAHDLIVNTTSNNQMGRHRAPIIDKETKLKLQTLKTMSQNFINMPPQNFAMSISTENNRSRDKAVDKLIWKIFNITQKGFVMNFEKNKTTLWTFAGALLYSVTVITTIG